MNIAIHNTFILQYCNIEFQAQINNTISAGIHKTSLSLSKGHSLLTKAFHKTPLSLSRHKYIERTYARVSIESTAGTSILLNQI